ncbi:hypothetical protein IAT40_005264 [Kwoniella sp. CBS 6097]
MSADSSSQSAQDYWPAGWSKMDVYGPTLIGGMFSCASLGIVWAATYSYYHRYHKDPLGAKALVAVLCALTTVDTVLLCSIIIETCVYNPGNFIKALEVLSEPIGWIRSLICALAGFITQGFMIHRFITFAYAIRIRTSSTRSKCVFWSGLTLLSGTCLLGLAGAIATAVILGSRTLDIAWNVQYTAMLIVDVILTILFSAYLHQSRTGFVNTNRVLNVLLLILLRNGLLMSAVQLCLLLLFKLSPTFWITFPTAIMSKVYTLTVLSILTKPRSVNERSHQKSMQPPAGIVDLTMGGQRSGSGSGSGAGSGSGLGAGINPTSSSGMGVCSSCQRRSNWTSIKSEDDETSRDRSSKRHQTSGLTFSEFLQSPDEQWTTSQMERLNVILPPELEKIDGPAGELAMLPEEGEHDQALNVSLPLVGMPRHVDTMDVALLKKS